MHLIIKKFKGKSKSSGLKHIIMSRKKFKSKPKYTTNKNMAKKKHSKSKKGFGRVSGFKIPVIGKALQNPLAQKAIKGAGTVALVGGAVQLLNNQQVNSLWNNQIVRTLTAYAGGDIVGAGTAYVLENPQLLNRVQGSQQSSSQAGFA